jgi:hypothetical protein
LRQDKKQGGKDTVSGWKPVYLTDRGDKVLPQKTPPKEEWERSDSRYFSEEKIKIGQNMEIC